LTVHFAYDQKVTILPPTEKGQITNLRRVFKVRKVASQKAQLTA
jgi:hypothetical protein